jgi:hypothetical protein
MTVFSTADEMYAHFTPFLDGLVSDPVVGPKLVSANTSFRVNYTGPDTVFILDATQDPAVVKVGTEALAETPEVELHMSADDGHRFWLGDLNIPVALARRKVKIDGPISKLLGMLPAITPAYSKYREYCQTNVGGSGG